MHVGNRITSVAGMALLLLNVAAAQGQTTAAVEFVDITDAVAGRFFDAAATEADPTDGNKLVIRFNTGRDPATWRANDFRASTAAFSHLSAMDTINFKIVPPAGHYVAKVTYTQQGTGSIVRTGKAAGGSNWIVGDYAADLGTYGSNPDLSDTVVLKEYWPILPVSITTGLHAFSTPLLGSAAVAITAAEVVVELAELDPLPIVEPDPLPVVEPDALPIVE